MVQQAPLRFTCSCAGEAAVQVVTSSAGAAASSNRRAKLKGSLTALKPSASSRVACAFRSDVSAEWPWHHKLNAV